MEDREPSEGACRQTQRAREVEELMVSMRFATVWAVGALLLLALVIPACAGGNSGAQSGGGGASPDQEAEQASVQLAESAGSGAGRIAHSSAVGSGSQGPAGNFDRQNVRLGERRGGEEWKSRG